MNFPIINDPQAEWVGGPDPKTGKYNGLYGRETMQKALCIDFDGTLHAYTSGWSGDDIVTHPPR